MAAVDVAADVFTDQVQRRVGAVSARVGAVLLAMIDAWLLYVEVGVFSGGCFFAAASAEFDDRPGAVRDRLAVLTGAWLHAIESQVLEAVEQGHLYADTDAKQVAFELHAFVQESNWTFRLHEDAQAFDRASLATSRTLARSRDGFRRTTDRSIQID